MRPEGMGVAWLKAVQNDKKTYYTVPRGAHGWGKNVELIAVMVTPEMAG